MRKRSVTRVLLVCIALTIPSTDAHAQRTSTDRIADLEQAVDALQAQAVQVPTLAAAVQEFGEQLAQLQRAVDELKRAQASIPDAQERLDRLRDRLETLNRELQNLRTEVADGRHIAVGPPSAHGGGGGVSYDDGFNWRTGDGRFAVALSGFLHGRYQLDVDDGDIDSSSLSVRRARLAVLGHVGSPRMTYHLQLDALSEQPLLDYQLEYAWRPYLQFRAGQYKVPFTRGFIVASSQRAFLELPEAIELLQYDRDAQFGIHGTLAGERVAYYVGVGNGAGSNVENDNLELMGVMRLEATVLGQRFGPTYADVGRTEEPALMLGLGLVQDLTAMPDSVSGIVLNTDVDGDGVRDNVNTVSASFDAIFRFRGLEAAFEMVFRREDFGTILSHSDNGALVAALGDRDSHTYVNFYSQLTYLLPKDLWSHGVVAGVRAGRSRVSFLALGDRISELPAGEHLTEVDVLLQVYRPTGYRLLGLMYSVHDYTTLEGIEGTGRRAHRVILETQLKF